MLSLWRETRVLIWNMWSTIQMSMFSLFLLGFCHSRDYGYTIELPAGHGSVVGGSMSIYKTTSGNLRCSHAMTTWDYPFPRFGSRCRYLQDRCTHHF